MKAGISTHIFALHQLHGAMLEDIAASGFRFMELWCSREHLGYHKPDRVKEIFRNISDNGLELVALHAPFYLSIAEVRAGRFMTLSSPEPSVRETARSEIEMLIENLPVEGPLPMVLHTGLTVSDNDPRREEDFLEGLEKLLPVFRRAGLLVALENGPSHHSSCGKIMELAERTGSADVGICLDTGHSNITGSPCDDISLCAPRLLDIHVHDNDGAKDQHRPPFGGNIPWEEFMAALKETGYDGSIMLETRGGEDLDTSLRESVRSAEKLGFFKDPDKGRKV